MSSGPAPTPSSPSTTAARSSSIEDDYLVTESGLERLGPPLERTIEEIERAMGA